MKRVSILVPVYNEWKTIQILLDKLVELDLNKEIIVVDDASDDGSAEVLRSIQHPLIQVIHHAANQGKGAAIRTALARSTGDIIIIQDADLEQDPEDFYQLVDPIMKNGAKVVYGSRFLKGRPRMAWKTYAANRFLSALTSLLYGVKLTDLETCYKVFDRSVIDSIKLECDRFDFEPEVTAKLLKQGIQIFEVAIKEDWYHGYNNNSKKVTWVDGISAIVTLLRYRFRA